MTTQRVTPLLPILLCILTLSSFYYCQVYPEGFFNGFENPLLDVDSGNRMATVTIAMSQPDGFQAATGGYYAKAKPTFFGNPDGAIFTRYGGYGGHIFPEGGYTTSVDVYLDVAESTDRVGNDNYKRFDWSSAINNAQQENTAHRRDFIIHCGTDLEGNFVFSASNNSPGNPRAAPNKLKLSDLGLGSGWYTLKHEFRDEGGVLAVEMSIIHKGVTLMSWTRSDSSDVIGVEVGGNRYGWLVINDFDTLEIDNVFRSGAFYVPKYISDCKKGGWQNLYRENHTPFKNQGDCIQYVNTGK